jgi:hypothetical protein
VRLISTVGATNKNNLHKLIFKNYLILNINNKMLLKSRQILTNYIVKRPYWTPNSNNIQGQGFIDYDKYVQDTYAKDKQINDIHLYYKHLNNINAEQKQTLKQIQDNISQQQYWIFHSVALSYVGLFAYIFKM